MAKKLSEDGKKPNVSADLIAEALAEYTSEMTSLASAQSGVQTVCKRYKKLGVNMKQIKAAHAARKLDPAEVEMNLRDQLRYFHVGQVLDLSKAKQAELFPDLESSLEPVQQASLDRLDRARAHGDGFNSGKHGAGIDDNPHHPGSVGFIAWREGWEDGSKARAAAGEPEQAEPRRRGRPPKQRQPDLEEAQLAGVA